MQSKFLAVFLLKSLIWILFTDLINLFLNKYILFKINLPFGKYREFSAFTEICGIFDKM